MKSVVKSKKNIKEKILIMIFSLIILCMGLYRISEHIAPIVLMDEFGYWSNAAFFAGIDWSEINQFNSYYSYGYSFFLAILLKVFGETPFLYKSAILLNIIMILGNFYLLRQIGKELFEEKNMLEITAFSFLAAFFPSFLANIHIAWCETALVFLYTLCVYLLIIFINYKTYIGMFIFIFVNFFIYITHQRGVGILFSGMLIFILICFNEKIEVKQFVSGILMYIVLLGIHGSIKQIILNEVFVATSNQSASINDYGSILGHLKVWANFEGLRKLIYSIAGKILYLQISSLGLFGISICCLFNNKKDWINRIREKKVNRNQIVGLFMIGSVLTTILIASIYTLDPKRLDGLVYGRYTEWLLAPFILIAFLYVNNDKKVIRSICIKNIVMTFLLLIIVLHEYSLHPEWEQFLAVCSWVMAFFVELGRTSKEQFLIIGGLIFGSFSLFLVMNLSKKKRKYIIFAIYSVFFIPCAMWGVNRVYKSNYRADICQEMNKYIKTEERVYFVNDYGEGLWYIADLQVMNPNIEFDCINEDEMRDISGYILVGTYDKKIDEDYYENSLVSNFQISLLHRD